MGNPNKDSSQAGLIDVTLIFEFSTKYSLNRRLQKLESRPSASNDSNAFNQRITSYFAKNYRMFSFVLLEIIVVKLMI